MKWFKKLRQSKWFQWVLQPLLILIPLVLLGRHYVTNWQALRAFDWQIDLLKFGLGLLLLLVAFALLPLALQQILAGLGCPIRYTHAYYGFYVSQLAKYLPGRVWVVPGRALALKRYGVDALSSSLGMLTETYLLAATAAVVSVPYALLAPDETSSALWYLSPLPLLILHPKIFNKVLRWVVARGGHDSASVHLSNRQVVVMIVIALFFWTVTGAGFAALVASVESLPRDVVWILPGAFSASWAAGSVAFLSPGGLGAREGALVLVLSPFLVTPIPAIVALLSRLWWTLADLLSWAIAFMAEKLSA
jgi:glycosyltransferase 2 family protein